ncbi:hypothetical protein JHK82_024526 [Glycine max]|nr:hypothetical protein JHK85_025125 [Glycine max]KAG5012363.1 hypothetical protein JHK86_024624 [Glycine max]KAG5133338.1 hypothetical protein JHK82_024526 [Glycine max]
MLDTMGVEMQIANKSERAISLEANGQAFAVIVASPLQVDLSCVLEHVVVELTAFLQKANRALRQATLGTLNSLIVAYGDKIVLSAYEVIIVELSGLISFDSLLESLLACAKPSPQSGGIAKQALHSIAQCVVVLCLAAGDQKCSSIVKMLIDILKDDNSSNSVIVRQSVDKAEFQESSVEKLLNLLFNHCESEEEGVCNVVAECLGKIALIEPVKLIPALKVRTTSPAAFTQATVVIAVKYSIVEHPEKIDERSYTLKYLYF